MNATAAQAVRLRELYALNIRVTAEIAQIEAAIHNEIEALRRAREAAKKKGIKIKQAVAECGTDGGYYRHIRTTKTPPCDACKLAHRIAEAIREQARRERDGAA